MYITSYFIWGLGLGGQLCPPTPFDRKGALMSHAGFWPPFLPEGLLSQRHADNATQHGHMDMSKGIIMRTCNWLEGEMYVCKLCYILPSTHGSCITSTHNIYIGVWGTKEANLIVEVLHEPERTPLLLLIWPQVPDSLNTLDQVLKVLLPLRLEQQGHGQGVPPVLTVPCRGGGGGATGTRTGCVH